MVIFVAAVRGVAALPVRAASSHSLTTLGIEIPLVRFLPLFLVLLAQEHALLAIWQKHVSHDRYEVGLLREGGFQAGRQEAIVFICLVVGGHDQNGGKRRLGVHDASRMQLCRCRVYTGVQRRCIRSRRCAIKICLMGAPLRHDCYKLVNLFLFFNSIP
ncbi:hypothetical protein DFJ77DRAFT_452584 [Powellomyces hirtus]|nr:hypothetical protein DFJ77DRAFT_452584 [Powellomyces hirtus]